MKYDNYKDAYEHETINLLRKQQEELDERIKLEHSLNTLASFAIAAICAIIALLIYFTVAFALI